MLIDAVTPPDGLEETGLRWWRNERFTLGWKGHLFLSGQTAGPATVAEVARLLETQDLSEVARHLYGVFGLLVHDRQHGGWQVTVDNTGLYKIYHDETRVSTGLLELLRARRAGSADVESAALVEYLAHGAVCGSGTFVAGIDKLRHDEILELSRPAGEGATKHLRKKELAFPSGDDERAVLEYFAGLAGSLAGRQLSVDVTGGFDTRLILALLLHHGVEFETSISGWPGVPDCQIAEQLAELAGRPFHATWHDLGRLEQELEEAFIDGDGQTDVCHFHRIHQHNRDRRARGVEVMAHGGGGAHFKDFYSYQDFPWYGSSKVNFERYYDLRIVPIALQPRHLAPPAAALLASVRAQTLDRFRAHRAPTNNESYDRAAFFVRDPEIYGRMFSNHINLGLDVVAPYFERRCIEVSFRMSPWSRFMNGWHRRMTTRFAPTLAAVPTTEGYSASTELRHLLPDLLGYGATQLRRVAKKTSQRVLGRTMFHSIGAPANNAPDLLPRVRATGLFAEAVERLKVAEILATDLDPTAIPDTHVGRVLNAGLLLRHLDRPAAHPPGIERREAAGVEAS